MVAPLMQGDARLTGAEQFQLCRLGGKGLLLQLHTAGKALYRTGRNRIGGGDMVDLVGLVSGEVAR